MEDKTRFHVFISGKVQGVFFRRNTIKEAEKLGVYGWVKNLSDGRVEAVFEGDTVSVKKILEWVKRGPLFAKVENFISAQEEYRGEFSSFNKK
jgi:acylphosphatase